MVVVYYHPMEYSLLDSLAGDLSFRIGSLGLELTNQRLLVVDPLFADWIRRRFPV